VIENEYSIITNHQSNTLNSPIQTNTVGKSTINQSINQSIKIVWHQSSDPFDDSTLNDEQRDATVAQTPKRDNAADGTPSNNTPSQIPAGILAN
jgi:hypothetical protein